MQTQKVTTHAPTTPTTWTIDPTHTAADYTVRHMFTRFRGVFRNVEGTIRYDATRPERTQVNARIDVRNIDTGLPDRDTHLKSADFFDAEQHPYMTFESQSIERANDHNYRMRGNLTIRGITRPISLDIEHLGEGPDAWGGHRAGAIGRTRIDRKEYGMTWNTALDQGGIVLGDKIDIELHVEAIRVG